MQIRESPYETYEHDTNGKPITTVITVFRAFSGMNCPINANIAVANQVNEHTALDLLSADLIVLKTITLIKMKTIEVCKRVADPNPTSPARWISLLIGAITALVVAALLFVSCTPTPEVSSPVLSQEEMIKRGLYLTTIGGCNDCHSPKVMTPQGPVPDTSRLLSGHPQDEPLGPIIGNQPWILFSPGLTATVGPWGASFAANLTPDDTGTGTWSYEQFEMAIRKGKLKGLAGSRDLLPPMPWQMFKAMSDEDLRSIFAYLQSIKPVHNVVPPPIAPQDLALVNLQK